jgi:hypothetical protein
MSRGLGRIGAPECRTRLSPTATHHAAASEALEAPADAVQEDTDCGAEDACDAPAVSHSDEGRKCVSHGALLMAWR